MSAPLTVERIGGTLPVIVVRVPPEFAEKARLTTEKQIASYALNVVFAATLDVWVAQRVFTTLNGDFLVYLVLAS